MHLTMALLHQAVSEFWDEGIAMLHSCVVQAVFASRQDTPTSLLSARQMQFLFRLQCLLS